MKGLGVCHRALSMAFMLLAVGGLEAATLWNNGALSSTTYTTQVPNGSGGNPCDSVCVNGAQPLTVFDNFNLGVSQPGSMSAVVTGFDFTDFLVGISSPVTGTQTVKWSLWTGDPFNGVSQVMMSGTASAVLSPVGLTPCTASACLEMFTVSLGAGVTLSSSQTYYLGTTVVAAGNYLTYRATSIDTNPGQSSYQGWEQSNGSINAGNSWSTGSVNTTFPNGSSGVTGTDSAFDIIGNVSAPEPGTVTLISIALAGLCFMRRRTA